MMGKCIGRNIPTPDISSCMKANFRFESIKTEGSTYIDPSVFISDSYKLY